MAIHQCAALACFDTTAVSSRRGAKAGSFKLRGFIQIAIVCEFAPSISIHDHSNHLTGPLVSMRARNDEELGGGWCRHASGDSRRGQGGVGWAESQQRLP